MGQEAEVQEITEEEVEATGDELEVEAESEGSEDVDLDESGDESETQSDSNDAKLSQEEVNRIVSKRVNKLQRKAGESDSRADNAEAELKLLREQNTLKDLALEQAKAAQSDKPIEPNPDEFDGGVSDPDYIKANREYIKTELRAEFKQQVAEGNRNTTDTINKEAAQKALEKRQLEYATESEKVQIKDFDVAEDVVLSALGLSDFNYIISTVTAKQSPLLVNYLGKAVNASDLQGIAEAAKNSDPAKAGIIIGGILAKLKPGSGKPKTLPPPDTEISGSSSSKLKSRGPKGAKYY